MSNLNSFPVPDFAFLGIFAGVGQTEVDPCDVISGSNRSLFEVSTQTTKIITASVTTPLDTESNSNTQKEDIPTITSTKATSPLTTSTSSPGTKTLPTKADTTASDTLNLFGWSIH